MLGFLQIGISGLASASIGIFDSKTMLPMTLIFAATAWIAFAILLFGKRFIPRREVRGGKRRAIADAFSVGAYFSS